ncbi:MAG: response regulator transcription factor [Candidatus Nanopelagicales bacterium]
MSPDPVLWRWGSSIAWPGTTGAAIIGVRRHVAADAEVVLEALQSGTPSIVLGVPSSERAVVDLLRAGAKEVLARDCSPADLIHAVHTLRRHQPAPRRTSRSSPTEPTARELEVTALLAQGMSNRQIAAMLFISEHTVRNHLGHVFAKLGVSSRTQAVVRAGQLGWLRLPG